MNRRRNRLYLDIFSKLSPYGILWGLFFLTQDILKIQNQLSLLLLQFVLGWPPFWLKITGLIWATHSIWLNNWLYLIKVLTFHFIVPLSLPLIHNLLCNESLHLTPPLWHFYIHRTWRYAALANPSATLFPTTPKQPNRIQPQFLTLAPGAIVS